MTTKPAKFTLFKNSFTDLPEGKFDFPDFIDKIETGHWKKLVEAVRAKYSNEIAFKKSKAKLPAVTISGDFKTRDKNVDLKHRLKQHSGMICIDVDKKDNVKMRAGDLVDKDCLAQFTSCSGEGIKIIYKCTPVKSAEEHRRIYDAVMERLQKKAIRLKADPIVKSISSLQYVSYDADLFYHPATKLIVKPLPPIKREKQKPSEDKAKELAQLNAYIDALGNKDVTKDYENWMLVLFGIAYSLGESGRAAMHRICSNYSDYSELECDEKFDSCLERNTEEIAKPVTLATVFQILNAAIPKPALKRLARKYNQSHAVGVGEDEEHGDLAGLVRYKLFLFKKVFDKETNTLTELIPHMLNLNAFEALLKGKGFFRFQSKYVQVVDNIVTEVDLDDILRIITKHIESDGNYVFTYKKLEFNFSWEEIVHLWRVIRAMGTTYNQISSSLEHWVPNLLCDSATESFIPYLNGVVKVTAKKCELIKYASLNQQIWKERILPREFKYEAKAGMFEHFFANVMGRGKDAKSRRASEHFQRALWYFGYMLQGTKRQSTARAWLLYDIKPGNNGRSGKTIIGNAVAKIRSVVTLDGKRMDFRDRFAFQTVQPWTDVVFIDDPHKQMSLVPLFNMISGDLSADRKGLEPITKSVKFMIASNWILEAEGESEIGRQFVSQLDDFYVRYSREHSNTITPIVHLHGKEFFRDWAAKDWAAFDSFAVRALQHHFKSASPANTIIGNAALIRFIQLYEEELFFDLATSLVQGGKPLANGTGCMVPRQNLTSIILESREDLKATRAGRIAREFLQAVGAKDVEVTSANVGSQVKMMYRFKNKIEDLNFGEYRKTLKFQK